MQQNCRQKIVRNNGRNIGTINIYFKGMKRSLLFMHFILNGDSKLFLQGINDQMLSENYYNGILYVMGRFDTINSIVHSYLDDEKEVQEVIEVMSVQNGMDASTSYPDRSIYLINVPESKLEEFGYTSNYQLFDIHKEIDARLDFLNKVLSTTVFLFCYDEKFVSDLKLLESEYNSFKENGECSEDVLVQILDGLKVLSDKAKKIGFTFSKNLLAFPLKESLNYNVYKSYL